MIGSYRATRACHINALAQTKKAAGLAPAAQSHDVRKVRQPQTSGSGAASSNYAPTPLLHPRYSVPGASAGHAAATRLVQVPTAVQT